MLIAVQIAVVVIGENRGRDQIGQRCIPHLVRIKASGDNCPEMLDTNNLCSTAILRECRPDFLEIGIRRLLRARRCDQWFFIWVISVNYEFFRRGRAFAPLGKCIIVPDWRIDLP